MPDCAPEVEEEEEEIVSDDGEEQSEEGESDEEESGEEEEDLEAFTERMQVNVCIRTYVKSKSVCERESAREGESGRERVREQRQGDCSVVVFHSLLPHVTATGPSRGGAAKSMQTA